MKLWGGAGMKIYTDGGCNNRSRAKHGGWAFVVEGEDGEFAHRAYGWALGTTSNRMELTAAIRALEYAFVNDAGQPTIYSDSRYLVDGANGWARSWRRYGWVTASGVEAANRDLWERILALTDERVVFWHWVRGHAGTPLNEEADRLCTRAARRAVWRDQRARGLA